MTFYTTQMIDYLCDMTGLDLRNTLTMDRDDLRELIEDAINGQNTCDTDEQAAFSDSEKVATQVFEYRFQW